ncbi:MAG: pyridoxal phosphate-dependent decarboxylase family protein [Draconibacterium sp.]
MQYWKKLTQNEIRQRVNDALNQNIDYHERSTLGVPASHLDAKVFNKDANFLDNAPFLKTMVDNPNHIGCHTMGESEPFFAGTQKLEKELIGIVAEDILKSKSGEYDGYVASGGTEANLQAIWIYRNLFKQDFAANHNEICILCSEDSHYSMPKAGNVLNLDVVTVPVTDNSREIESATVEQQIQSAKEKGKKYFIVVANMMTTMFGSVDNIEIYSDALTAAGVNFRIHIDGAFGGFVYPFSTDSDSMTFANPHVSSVTLDAHKMVQAPFGTGIFIARKGLINYVFTNEAQYVSGLDATLIGSRSGANAVAVWMILQTYGPNDWFEKIHILNYRANWLCNQLKETGVEFYRHPGSNIVTIRAHHIGKELAHKYGLVPDQHNGAAQWYKIVIMEHVHIDHLIPFIEELKTK